MNVSEFRTGNLLNYTNSEGDTLPTFLDWQDLRWLEEDPADFSFYHNYIPLNDEWMLKCGFNKVGINYEKGGFLLWKNKVTDTLDFVLNEPNSYKRITRHLRYLHELQNLFFALSGEELTTDNLQLITDNY